MRSTPGAPTERPPITPVVRDSGLPSGSWNRCSSADGGAVSRPSKDCTLLAVVVHQEGAAADAGRLRLDQRQHQLGGDGGVDRGAALLQHLVAGFDRQRIGGGHHVFARTSRPFR
jgi:hypothetical protein